MRRLVFIVILLSAASAALAQEKSVRRPPILGISHVRFHVSQRDAALHSYQGLLGMAPGKGLCENEHLVHLRCLGSANGRWGRLDSLEQGRPRSLFEEGAFATPHLEGLRRVLLRQAFP